MGNSLSNTPTEAFNTYLLGHVLSFSLLCQGVEHFHCSAVVVDGAAVCFLGNCGYGKSTLAASFVSAGHRLLSDDILVFHRDSQSNGIFAYPGPPRIKLYPAISRKVLGDGHPGTRMNPMTSKLIIPLDGSRSCKKAVPVRAIYALNQPSPKARSTTAIIRRLSERRAFLKVIQGAFNGYVTEPERLRNQFFVSREVASRISVKGISYPRTMRGLWSARDAILADLAKCRS